MGDLCRGTYGQAGIVLSVSLASSERMISEVSFWGESGHSGRSMGRHVVTLVPHNSTTENDK